MTDEEQIAVGNTIMASETSLNSRDPAKAVSRLSASTRDASRHRQDDPFAVTLIELAPGLRRYALKLCKNPHVADDLVQSTMENALRANARGNFTPQENQTFQSSVARFAGAIIRNSFMNTVRRQRETVSLFDENGTCTIDGFKIVQPRQETIMELQEVMSVVASLPDDHRTSLLSIALGDDTYESLAERDRISVGTAKSRVFRARTMIERSVDPSLHLKDRSKRRKLTEAAP